MASGAWTWWRTGGSASRAARCTSVPAALALILAHADLEDLTLERDLHHEKARLEPRWSELVYDGMWYSPLRSALQAFITESQRHVTGEVRLRFAAPGTCTVVGRRSPVALYDHDLATYDASDTFRHADAEGFVRLWGLGVATWSARQGSRSGRGWVMTLWEGRISTGMADAVAEFTVSLPFDRVLASDDLAGSRAHVKGLGKAGILSDSEVSALVDALDIVEEEFATGVFAFAPGDEDVHTAIERRVTELIGDVGAKLHTGRSRNDQVATALRLWCRRSLIGLAEEIMAFQDVLAQRAREAADVYLPGYTHMQRAQPVLLAHHLLAHGWALARDVDRLLTTVDRLNISPLGAGALAGSSLPLDPDYVAAELGFHGRFENSLDAVSDRDFVAESLFDLALLGVHLSRMGEEIVLWSTEEFGFCTLHDAYATGSSMLPQKKNPDVAELARGKSGRLIGHLTAVLVMLKGLPLAYNRDLQEDKEPLFDAVQQVSRALTALRGVYETATWNEERMQTAADGPAAAAIDLAEMLVEQGMPFRQAHALVGGLVRESLERHVPLVELVAAHPDLGEAAVELLEPGVAVTRRRTPGGAGPGPVAEQSERFARRREVDRTRLAQWRPLTPST